MKAVEIYKQHLTFKNYSRRTIKTYSHYLEKFLNETGKNPYHITLADITKYLLSQKYTSVPQQNQVIGSLKLFAKYNLNRRNMQLEKIERPKREKKLPLVLDGPYIKEKIAKVKNIKHKAILAIALCCWLRKSELLNLRIQDVNGSLRQVHIHNSKGCKDRVIPISKNTLEILRQYYMEHKPKEYLFNGQNGGKYSPTSVDKITKKYLYPNMRFHQIRASGSTFAVANGTDLKTVSYLLGHAHLKTTEHYIPILYENIKTAI